MTSLERRSHFLPHQVEADFGKTVSRLEGSVDKSAEFVSEKLLNRAGKAEIESWLKSWM